MSGDWEEREIGLGAVLIPVGGKLRGSKARQLGELLSEMPLRRDPITRVVLDMRDTVTVDSLGTQAIEDAHEGGVEIALVARAGLELDDGRPVKALSRRGLSVHTGVEAAISSLRIPAIAS
jgi:anti-anti-sigma regulatory factor